MASNELARLIDEVGGGKQSSSPTTPPAKPKAAPASAKPKAAPSATADVSAPSSLMEDAVRAALASSGVIEDTVSFAETNGFEHTNLIGVCKSLASNDFIACANLSKNVVRLSGEGRTVASGGSPEAEVFALVPATGSIPQDKLATAAGPAAKVGLAKAVQNKWLEVAKEDGAKVVKRAVASIVDAVQQQLQAVEAAGDQEAAIPADALAMLKKRNLIAVRLPALPALPATAPLPAAILVRRRRGLYSPRAHAATSPAFVFPAGGDREESQGEPGANVRIVGRQGGGRPDARDARQGHVAGPGVQAA